LAKSSKEVVLRKKGIKEPKRVYRSVYLIENISNVDSGFVDMDVKLIVGNPPNPTNYLRCKKNDYLCKGKLIFVESVEGIAEVGIGSKLTPMEILMARKTLGW